ncbi:chromosome segregation in meiosis- protein [Arachnomyces sp. PD_36]|nr:chromosome segregation in meiosis- protein [Arachnomyces sp. PD_36]
MATTQDNRNGSAANDTVNNNDDLFDYDVGIEDILNGVSSEANNSSNSKNQNQLAASKASGAGAGLGLDEEVTVTKKRKPTVKFDETRLLSQAGIPKLRKTAKTSLKFKGKGHEFSDAARLLNFYQLWLDDLFPRAKFADGLSMVEKLGHSKRIQVMRKEWIDEGKPRLYYEDENNDTNTTADTNRVSVNAANNASEERRATSQTAETGTAGPSRTGDTAQQPEPLVPSIFGGGSNTVPSRPLVSKGNMEDDDGLFVTDDEDNSAPAQKDKDSGPPDEDDLDALLAEHEVMEAENSGNQSKPGNGASGSGPSARRPPDDDFEDEMEAMAEMGGPW